MQVFVGGGTVGEQENSDKNLLLKGWEATNTTHMWHQVWKFNQEQLGQFCILTDGLELAYVN